VKGLGRNTLKSESSYSEDKIMKESQSQKSPKSQDIKFKDLELPKKVIKLFQRLSELIESSKTDWPKAIIFFLDWLLISIYNVSFLF